MVSDAAAQHGQAGLRYFIADRYVRAFQALASSPNTRLVVVPMESAALAGGIVQAMQLLRGDDGSAAGQRAADGFAARANAATPAGAAAVPPHAADASGRRRFADAARRLGHGGRVRRRERLDHLAGRGPRPCCCWRCWRPGCS